jgi:hypothetical protein
MTNSSSTEKDAEKGTEGFKKGTEEFKKGTEGFSLRENPSVPFLNSSVPFLNPSVPFSASFSGVAFNQVPDSDNRIHSDELAQAYGFRGALVPGVTVSAYLIQPAIERWGLDWLTRGWAHAVVKSPVYDGEHFDVDIAWHADAFQCRLSSGAQHCAEAKVVLPGSLAGVLMAKPERRGDRLMPEDYKGPEVTPDLMAELQASGCMAKKFLWSPAHEMAAYFRLQKEMPALLRPDLQPGSGGYANMSFLLGCANRHFAAVAKMSPWVHLQTSSQNFQAVPLHTVLVSEMSVLELFNKKGHEFADCEFNLYRADDDSPVCRIVQRAIYKLRGSSEHSS